MNSTDPTSIDEHAPVIARHALFIAAPLETLWDLHADIDRWPSWQDSIDTAHLDGRFEPGATFTWTTFGMHIASSVYQVDPMRHTLWGGPSEGILGLHAWTFTPEAGGVMVTTEESWTGQPVDANKAELQTALDGSLASWLQLLAAAAVPAGARS